MPVSNPVTFFVSPSKSESFTFEVKPNSKLYNWCPSDCGLSKTMSRNMMFMATDEVHAKEIIKASLEFELRCLNIRKSDHEDQVEWDNLRHVYVQKLLDNTDAWKFNEVNPNQLFIVPWASNDTIG